MKNIFYFTQMGSHGLCKNASEIKVKVLGVKIPENLTHVSNTVSLWLYTRKTSLSLVLRFIQKE